MVEFTRIEQACSEARDTGRYHHVVLYFPDGSYLSAPATDFGPNWVCVSDLRASNFMIDTADAEIDINYDPGPVVALGPRLSHVATSRDQTPIEMFVNNRSGAVFARDIATFHIEWPDGSTYLGPVKMAWPNRAEIEIRGERDIFDVTDADVRTVWEDDVVTKFDGPLFHRFVAAAPGM